MESDGLEIQRVGALGKKGGGGRVGERGVGNNACRPTAFAGQIQKGGKPNRSRLKPQAPVVWFLSRGQRPGGGCGIGDGKIVRLSAEQREVRKFFDLQPVVRTARVNPRSGQDRRAQVIRNKKNDGKRPLNHPVQANQGQKTITNFFAHRKSLCRMPRAGNRNFR